MAQPRPVARFLSGLAVACLGFLWIYGTYWPADSTSVQSGDARFHVAVVLLALLATAGHVAGHVAGRAALPAAPPAAAPATSLSTIGSRSRFRDRWDAGIELLTWALPVLIACSLWVNRDQANLRLAINEAWWWFAAAGLFSVARYWLARLPLDTVVLRTFMALAAAVAVYGWFQLLVDIPLMIELYERHPDAVLRAAGIDAEPGSALRIVFQNRLYDGGPTGPFALANSMGVLLVGGSLVAFGLLRCGWRDGSAAYRVVGSLILLLVVGMLVASRSRASLLALVLVLGGWAISDLIRVAGRGQLARRLPSRQTLGRFAAGLAIGLPLVGVLVWRLGRHSEWIGQAPLSIEIRLRYWLASARMLGQSPWLGIGPGQFKSRYENFRGDASTEQIADPHHWLWQVLTTGGLLAGVAIVALLVGIFWAPRRQVEKTAVHAGQRSTASWTAAWWIAGCAAAVAVVWAMGAVLGQVPSVLPAMLATFAAIGVAAFFCLGLPGRPVGTLADTLSGNQPDLVSVSSHRIATWAALGMIVNLFAAGGWLVPGIAIPLWLLLAVVATANRSAASAPQNAAAVQPSSAVRLWGAVRWIPLAVILMLLAGWYLSVARPLQRQAVALNAFQRAWSFGSTAAAIDSLQQAVEADRWDPQSSLQQLLASTQLSIALPAERARWQQIAEAAEADVLGRSGADPVPLRVLADSRLWRYQRYGGGEDLAAAQRFLETAVRLAPAHETYAAQLAEVYRQSGDPRALPMAQRAQTLSAAGGYYERTLPFLLLLPATPIGEAVAQQPRKQSAADLLPPILAAVDSQTQSLPAAETPSR